MFLKCNPNLLKEYIRQLFRIFQRISWLNLIIISKLKNKGSKNI